MNVTTSSGCCSAITSVQVMAAGILATCRVQSGYLDRSSIALNLPVASWRCWNFALGVDRIDNTLFQRRFQRTEGQVALVVALQPQFRRVFHGVQHLRIVVPVVRIGEFHDLDVVHGHAVHPEHQLDALMLLDAPPVVLDLVHALRETDLLAFQILHPVDVVPWRAPSCSRLRAARASHPSSLVRRMSA
jgi:hypothetical protein